MTDFSSITQKFTNNYFWDKVPFNHTQPLTVLQFYENQFTNRRQYCVKLTDEANFRSTGLHIMSKTEKKIASRCGPGDIAHAL